ncbi:MAG: polyprenol monophosphomannose synthase [Protaetiibacter sp.]
MVRLAIAVPTYNEVNNVDSLIAGISEVAEHARDVDVTLHIIDDSSPDGTADHVRALAPSVQSPNFHVEVIDKPAKEGLGAAYIYGFERILTTEPDYVLQMDADLSHDPKCIAGFIHQARVGKDFVVASRYIPGGGTPDWSFNRRFLSRGGNIYARMLLSRRITDYTGGFNMYSRSLLERISPSTIRATGYGFLLVLKYRALLSAESFIELPIVFLDRTHGSSKIPRSTLIRNFLLVPLIRLRRGR